MSDDRRVHATTRDGTQVVRYERAGKWYAERPAKDRAPSARRSLTFAQAVDMAVEAGSRVYLGLPGGSRFDAEVMRAPSRTAYVRDAR